MSLPERLTLAEARWMAKGETVNCPDCRQMGVLTDFKELLVYVGTEARLSQPGSPSVDLNKQIENE